MPTLFDPVVYLATLGVYAKVSLDADGERYITLEFKRGISSKVQLQAKAISKRYGRALDAARRTHGAHAAHHSATCGRRARA